MLVLEGRMTELHVPPGDLARLADALQDSVASLGKVGEIRIPRAEAMMPGGQAGRQLPT